MNAYESGEQKSIPAVLVYVRHQGRTLMIHRNTRDLKSDDHFGKWNGLGGKCEREESYVDAACRELKEESGLEFSVDRFQFLGFLQFPNFKSHKNEDWNVMVFGITANDRDIEALGNEAEKLPGLKTEEGTLHWIKDSEVLSLNLWSGDRHFIPYVLESKPFFGSITYEGPEVIRARVSVI